MYLKELTTHGFKSFAKKGELEFSTPITAIVGPNGSGKSNVAEAFRFVLGEQSMKSMRGKKGEDLIWGGSEGSPRANRASVTITLNNEKKTFPIDYDEIVIERIVHRDGTNEYLINGSRARLKDVQELLAAGNIGSTGHHIISQGEADRILTASPMERREMIEDALGLKVYQYKKAEAQRKLKKTTENIGQVQSLRREVKPHLTFLERQVKKIERSHALREELKDFYCEYLRREDAYIAFHRDRLTNERVAPEKERKSLAEQLADAKAKMAHDGEDEKRDELVALEEKMAAVRGDRQELIRKSGQLEGQTTFLKRRISDAQKKHEQTTRAPIAYAAVQDTVAAVERSAEKATASDDASVLKAALTEVVKAVKELLSQTDTAGPDTSDDEKELAGLITQKEEVDTELSSVKKAESELQEQYEELKRSIDEEDSESREAEREVFRIMNAQRDVDEKLAQIDAELQTLERDRADFKRELQEAVTLLGSALSRYYDFVVQDGDRVLEKNDFIDEDRGKQRERQRELEKMKIRLEELGVGATDEIMKEYKEVKERDAFLEHEINDLNASVEKLETLIAELTEELNQQFVSGIDKIGTEFTTFFTLMFGGGEAKLVRVKPKVRKADVDEDASDTEDDTETEEGIEIDVKLPNKRVRGLDMLSGGERALTSIALIFAMSQVNPPPFIVLDETDAALDEANSRRYGDMIESLAKHSQLILITHNRETMSRAGVLYGVTMGGDGISKLLSVKFDEAVAVAK